MFSGIRRVLGNIKVTQTGQSITITGIPANVMTRDIQRIWKTSKINMHMFTSISKNTVVFPTFFAPDVMYMLERMTEHRSRNVSIRVLTKIKDRLLADTWLGDTQIAPKPRVDLKRLSNLIYKPLDYQQRFFESYDLLTQQYHLLGYLLAAAAGSGKTYITFALAECLSAKRIVVICPKTATERVWEAEVKKLFRKPQTYWLARWGTPYKGERVAIFHYESLEKAQALAPQLQSDNTVVILDESHNLNDITSQRTQRFIDLCRQLTAIDILWASGTALKAMGSELIPMLRCIDPMFTSAVEARFKKIYGSDGGRGLDILNQRMGMVSFKVEKHELGLDKPIIKRLPVKIPNGKDYTLDAVRRDMQAFIGGRFKYYAGRKKDDHAFYDRCLEIHQARLTSTREQKAFTEYKQLVKDVIRAGGDPRQVGEEIKQTNRYEKHHIHPSLPKELRHRFKDVKSVVKYVHLKVQGEALGRVLGRKRIQCHVDMVPHVDFRGVCDSTPKKTVVFTSFVEALEKMDDHLKRNGMNPVVVYGKTTNELNRTVSQFGKNEDLNPLVATYQSLSTAVPLVMADTMIMLNAPFRSYIHEQAISRIHRLGADTRTRVWECFLDTGDEPNLSTRSADILEWSREQVAAIMGFESPFEVEETPAMETYIHADDLDLCFSYSLENHTAPVRAVPAYLDW